jgi:general secretion pathway protein C
MPEGCSRGAAKRLNHNPRMSARWWSFGVWALAAASAVYWGLKLWTQALPTPPQAVLAKTTTGLQGDLTRLLGADSPVAVAAVAAEPVADNRFALLGVVSPRSAGAAREGLALIAVDGKPAKAFRVGAKVDGEQVLQSVGARSASLGPAGGATQIALNIAPPAEAARGVPGGGFGAAPVVSPVSGGQVPSQIPGQSPSPAAVPSVAPSLPQPPLPPSFTRRVPPPIPGQENSTIR